MNNNELFTLILATTTAGLIEIGQQYADTGTFDRYAHIAAHADMQLEQL